MQSINGQNSQLWLVRLGTDLIGPMTHEEVMVGLQKGRWAYQDFVKKQGEMKWTAIENVRSFFPDYIKNADSNLFLKRATPRFLFKQWVLLHNQNELIKGVTYEIGQGGLGVLVDFVPKYWLKDWVIHIPSAATGSRVAFNVPCKMVGFRSQPERLICFQKTGEETKDTNVLWGDLIHKVEKPEKESA